MVVAHGRLEVGLQEANVATQAEIEKAALSHRSGPASMGVLAIAQAAMCGRLHVLDYHLPRSRLLTTPSRTRPRPTFGLGGGCERSSVASQRGRQALSRTPG
jgi:hypothetical protein